MAGHQISALLWKNTLLRYRSWGSCIVEIGLPLMITVLLVLMQMLGERNIVEAPMPYPEDIVHDYHVDMYYNPDNEAMTAMMSDGSYNMTNTIMPQKDKPFNETKREVYVNFLVEASASSLPKKIAFKTTTVEFYGVNEIYGEPLEHNYKRVSLTQHVLTKIFINYWHKKEKLSTPMPKEEFYLLTMPQRAEGYTPRQMVFRNLRNIFTFFFFGLAAFTTQSIVQEKESKIKESMKLMGLRTFSFWLTWFITSFIFGFIVCVVVTTGLSVPFGSYELILTSNPMLTLTFLMVYVMDVISFSFMVSCFLTKDKFAAIFIGSLFILLMFAVPLTFDRLKDTLLAHLGGCVIFQSGILYFLHMLVKLEERNVGMTLGSMRNHEVYPHLNLLDTLIMMITNTLFNLLIVWYMDNVYPGEYGIPRPYHFFLTRDYWLPSVESAEDIPELPPQDERFFEAPPSNLEPGIQVRGLVKVFKGNVAVSGTSMDLYKDQITVLLGHNGAGKTTTINMITGFLKPDKGTAIVNGYDIIKNLAEARKYIGLCPQHDILFPRLTCYEHLKFYSKLRGQYDPKKTNKDIDELLEEVGLTQKKKSYTTVLSGGQKRKLSVACAFIGGNNIVFLDEPSSGLDPSARRDLWAFLKNRRQGRAILLTTHYMDEADVLGDRIVIMADGVVKCYGTSNFLKRIYGAGYQMNIVKDQGCLTSKVTAVIQKHIPEARFSHETNAEIFYVLPDDQIKQYPKLLLALETEKSSLVIRSFGLEATTLETVFVRVGQGFEPNTFIAKEEKEPIATDETQPSVDAIREVERLESSIDLPNTTNNKLSDKGSTNESDRLFHKLSNYTKLTGLSLFLHQFKAIFYKKARLFSRNRFTSLVIIFLPLALTSIGIQSDNRLKQHSRSPDLDFTLDRFPTDLVFPLFYEEGANETIAKEYRTLVHGKYGTAVEYPIKLGKEMRTLLLPAFRKLLDSIQGISDVVYKEKYLFGLIEAPSVSKVFVLYQESTVHAQGIAMQLALDAWVQRSLGKDFSVQTGIQHTPSKAQESFNKVQVATTFCFGFSMALLPVIFIYPLISERAQGARHLQALSGVSPIAYWLGTFVFDMITYLISISLLMAAFQTQPEVYLAKNRWALTLIVLVLFGFATFPYLYIVQLLFKSPSKGVVMMLMVTVFIGILASVIMLVFADEKAFKTKKIKILHWFFTVICPNFSLTTIFTYYIVFKLNYKEEHRDLYADLRYYFNYELNGIPLSEPVYSLCTFTVAPWFILSLLEYRIARLLWHKLPASLFAKYEKDFGEEDDDVKQERLMIESRPREDLIEKNALVLINLRKSFLARCRVFVAVHNTSLALATNECLGLLGQNGAGKSTTFKMLTGDLTITSGKAYLDGLSVKTDIKRIQTKLGYCPQHDALHDSLTGNETLRLYARLRGVPEGSLAQVVQAVVDFVTLAPHENKLTKFYSGGNKRKLSVGISIIGDPKFIMLDEPTAGMDPMARRTLWNVLHLIRASGRNLVLTSHSMEECEALCTRIAIMVRGRVVCLGSVQHLKSKYGEGYTVILHAATDEKGASVSLDEAVQFVLKKFENSKIFSKLEAYVDIQVPETIPLSTIFATLETARSQYKFEHYSVQQTSLEQVFLRFMSEAGV